MNSVSIKDLVPLAISGLGAMAVPMQTFNYNDVEQNNIQLADNNALSHLKLAQDTYYGDHIHRFRFYQAYTLWTDHINYLSSPIQVIADPNFKAIVDLGYDAIPFIVQELEKEPSYLVWALNQIFGFKISDNPDTTIPEAGRLWVKYIKSLKFA
jgi:hypothetical protein